MVSAVKQIHKDLAKIIIVPLSGKHLLKMLASEFLFGEVQNAESSRIYREDITVAFKSDHTFVHTSEDQLFNRFHPGIIVLSSGFGEIISDHGISLVAPGES
jgi:hypothetical protein